MFSPVAATLASDRVQAVLGRLHARAEVEDEEAKQRVKAREAELGTRLAPPQRYELYQNAPLAITPEVGRLYYLMATSRTAMSIVEFGASHGISTIYLAAALRDLGKGSLITTEILPQKANWTAQNLEETQLDDLVEIRTGDALETLRDLPEGIDMLVLDGRNDQYISVFELVEPRLSRHALIVADLGKDDPDLQNYQRYLRDTTRGYVTVTLPLDAGIEATVVN
jgi:predicted O-methyltransferase YrrM